MFAEGESCRPGGSPPPLQSPAPRTVDRNPSPPSAAAQSTGPLRGIARKLFGDDGVSFRDVLDLVNPLQHIPVVGHVYRELTGDALSPAVRVAGGALFGGPLGAVLSVAGLVIERGKDAATVAPAPTDADTRVAAAAAEPPRGGWLIAAATTGSVAPFVPPRAVTPTDPAPSSVADAPSASRGGWLLGAAATPPGTALPGAMPGIEVPAALPVIHDGKPAAGSNPGLEIPHDRVDLPGLLGQAPEALDARRLDRDSAWLRDAAGERQRHALHAFASARALAGPLSERLSVVA